MKEQGFSLLEVLIALAIFALGSLGLAETELQALRQSQENNLLSQLNWQTWALSARLYHNLAPASVMNAWQQDIQQNFPQIKLTVLKNPGHYQLIYHWVHSGNKQQLMQTITCP